MKAFAKARTVLSAKTGGAESFSHTLTQTSFLQLSSSVLSLKGACPDSRRTSALTCGPYTLVPCAHHVTPSAEYTALPSSEYSTPSLSSCSESSYPRVYNDDKQKTSASYSLSTVEGIQQNMIQYGSIAGAFAVYEDFPTYTSGVYHHVSGSELGGHAMKIFGWGTEGGKDYWLVANSWNDECGDHVDEKVDSFAREAETVDLIGVALK